MKIRSSEKITDLLSQFRNNPGKTLVIDENGDPQWSEAQSGGVDIQQHVSLDKMNGDVTEFAIEAGGHKFVVNVFKVESDDVDITEILKSYNSINEEDFIYPAEILTILNGRFTISTQQTGYITCDTVIGGNVRGSVLFDNSVYKTLDSIATGDSSEPIVTTVPPNTTRSFGKSHQPVEVKPGVVFSEDGIYDLATRTIKSNFALPMPYNYDFVDIVGNRIYRASSYYDLSVNIFKMVEFNPDTYEKIQEIDGSGAPNPAYQPSKYIKSLAVFDTFVIAGINWDSSTYFTKYDLDLNPIGGVNYYIAPGTNPLFRLSQTSELVRWGDKMIVIHPTQPDFFICNAETGEFISNKDGYIDRSVWNDYNNSTNPRILSGREDGKIGAFVKGDKLYLVTSSNMIYGYLLEYDLINHTVRQVCRFNRKDKNTASACAIISDDLQYLFLRATNSDGDIWKVTTETGDASKIADVSSWGGTSSYVKSMTYSGGYLHISIYREGISTHLEVVYSLFTKKFLITDVDGVYGYDGGILTLIKSDVGLLEESDFINYGVTTFNDISVGASTSLLAYTNSPTGVVDYTLDYTPQNVMIEPTDDINIDKFNISKLKDLRVTSNISSGAIYPIISLDGGNIWKIFNGTSFEDISDDVDTVISTGYDHNMFNQMPQEVLDIIYDNGQYRVAYVFDIHDSNISLGDLSLDMTVDYRGVIKKVDDSVVEYYIKGGDADTGVSRRMGLKFNVTGSYITNIIS